MIAYIIYGEEVHGMVHPGKYALRIAALMVPKERIVVLAFGLLKPDIPHPLIAISGIKLAVSFSHEL